MAKEFKDWDKVFTKAEIATCRQKWLYDNLEGRSEKDLVERGNFHIWPDYIGYMAVSIEEARHAVYKADGFRDWQLFRVSLKGLSTVHKLFMLGHYWKVMCDEAEDEDSRTTNLHRIWNYIGALKRGGQLVDCVHAYGTLIINR
jgi:hypothetical protein